MTLVVVVTTGGTIATTADPDGVARPTRRGEALLGGLATSHDVRVHDVLARDSSDLGPPEWDVIAAAVRAAVDDGAGGVVVTHGTDTMEETALWLDVALPGPTPVVLTGAMRSADAPDADGPANLRDAIAVAEHPAAAGLGVAVCMAGDVRRPLGLSKVPDGFTGHRVGAVREGSVHLDLGSGSAGSGGAGSAGDGPHRPRLAVGAAASAPRVDVVAVSAGSDAVALDAVVAAGARGVVLEALGSGNAGREVIAGVERARAAGVAVVIASRVPGAVVAPRYGPGRALVDLGAVPVRTLRPPQARVLLMAALSAGAAVADVFATWG